VGKQRLPVKLRPNASGEETSVIAVQNVEIDGGRQSWAMRSVPDGRSSQYKGAMARSGAYK